MSDPTPAPAPVDPVTPAPVVIDPTPAPTPDAAPAVTPTPAAPQTALDNPGDPVVTVQADWPTDWREKMAAGDEKTLNMLKRHGDLGSLAKKLREQDTLISSGQVKKPLDANATAEQVAAYRKDNGIPDAPTGYYDKLPDGLVIGEVDKPYYDGFMEFAHEKNLAPDLVATVMDGYHKILERQQADFETEVKQTRMVCEDALHKEWGSEFRGNMNATRNFVVGFFGEQANDILSARKPDGTLLFNDANMIKAFHNVVREVNPVGDLMSVTQGSQMQSVQGRLDELTAEMQKDATAFGKNNEKVAERIRLIDAKLKLQARGH